MTPIPAFALTSIARQEWAWCRDQFPALRLYWSRVVVGVSLLFDWSVPPLNSEHRVDRFEHSTVRPVYSFRRSTSRHVECLLSLSRPVGHFEPPTVRHVGSSRALSLDYRVLDKMQPITYTADRPFLPGCMHQHYRAWFQVCGESWYPILQSSLSIDTTVLTDLGLFL